MVKATQNHSRARDDLRGSVAKAEPFLPPPPPQAEEPVDARPASLPRKKYSLHTGISVQGEGGT